MITVISQAPPGTSLAGHDASMREVEARLAAVPEIEKVSASIGAAVAGGFGGAGQARNGSVTIRLRHGPRRSAFNIAAEVRGLLQAVPGISVQVQVQGGGGGGGQPIQWRLQRPNDQVLAQLGDQVILVLRTVPGLRDLTNSAAVGLPEVRIQVDRGRAEDLGISAQAIGSAVRTAYGGVVATKYRRAEGSDLDVRLILADAARLDVDSVGSLPIQTSARQTVRLSQVAAISEVAGPTQISRRNQKRVVTVGANLDPGLVLGNVTPLVSQAVRQIALPPG